MSKWNAKWERFDKRIRIHVGDDPQPIAWVDYDDVDHDQAEADAHLIAAAPELYEALELLLAKVRCGSALECQLCEKADAALAKARGEKSA